MGETFRAALKAGRSVYVLVLFVGAIAFLFPDMGIGAALFESYGDDLGLIKIAVGWALLGLLIEHTRVSLLKGRQAYLARALMRSRPDLRRDEAVRILIRALESGDDRVVENAHRELCRLTDTDVGRDPAAWKRWLTQRQTQDRPDLPTSAQDLEQG